ncbi:MAG: histidine phosphatase family protein [Acidimicrobiales bacterium]
MAGPEGHQGGRRAGQEPGASTARIYLVRHGRTALNAAGALRGDIDVALDSVGRQQAANLGHLLAKCRPRGVVTSPLRRAVETAGAIAHQAGVGTWTDERLADRGYGRWAGTLAAEVVARWGSLDAAPGVEPATEVADRALAALADITEASIEAPTVVVSHDAVNRAALAALDPSLGPPDDIPQDTGCLNVIERHKAADGSATWRVLSVNELPRDIPQHDQPEPDKGPAREEAR